MAHRSVYAVLSKAETLYQTIHGFDVDGGPGQPGPLAARPISQVIAAGVLREIAALVRDPRRAEAVKRLGRDLIGRAAAELGDAYNDGPPWLDYPWPLPWPPKKFDPKISVFEKIDPAALDALLAGVAQRLAEAVSTDRAGSPGGR